MFCLSIVLSILTGFGEWVCVGPEGGEITALIQSTQNPAELYALSGYNPTMVLISHNQGDTWENIGTFTGSDVYDMTMTSSGILVAFGGHMVWRSTDGGVNWTSVSVSNTYFYQGVAHPTDGNTVMAAAYRYIDSFWRIAFMKSTNGGQTWTSTQISTSSTHAYGRSIAVSATDPDVIIVGGYEPDGTIYQRLYLSENGGAAFTDITPPSTTNEYYTYGAAIHPDNPDIMLAGTQNSVYRTTDRGATWVKTASQYYNYRLKYSTVDPELVFAGAYNNIYRSLNGGQTWSSFNSGLSGYNFQHVVPSTTDTDNVYTGSNTGFFSSTSQGVSWNMSVEGMLAGKVLVGCRAGGYMYIQLQSLGLFRSPIGPSENWTAVNQASGCGDLAGLVSDGNQMLLALEAGG